FKCRVLILHRRTVRVGGRRADHGADVAQVVIDFIEVRVHRWLVGGYSSGSIYWNFDQRGGAPHLLINSQHVAAGIVDIIQRSVEGAVVIYLAHEAVALPSLKLRQASLVVVEILLHEL